MRVLLVDDEMKFAQMLAKRLALRGIEAEFVYRGEEAIARVGQGQRFDAAVLDVKMPGMSGIELRRELSRLDPGLKFIFLTGHGSNVDSEVAAAEAPFYLPKPLKIDELIEALERLVDPGGRGA